MKGRKNPYAKRLKKQVTIRMGIDIIEYFKRMSEDTGIPYQNLINLYLRECVQAGRKISIKWASWVTIVVVNHCIGKGRIFGWCRLLYLGKPGSCQDCWRDNRLCVVRIRSLDKLEALLRAGINPISAKLFSGRGNWKNEHRTLKGWTSNIERPTSNVEWEKMKKQKNKLKFALIRYAQVTKNTYVGAASSRELNRSRLEAAPTRSHTLVLSG